MAMRALVTGGTGFLGKKLALALLEKGWDVTALGRQTAKGEELRRLGIRFVQADLSDRDRVVDACAGQDAVFHCGARSAAWGPYAAFYESNVRGTEHVITGCLQHEVARLVHVSTPSVCFGASHRLNVRESDPLPARQASSYARTKRLAELAVLDACANGLPAVIVRPRALFGPEDGSIIPRLIEAGLTRGIPLIDGGNALIDLTYVDNAVQALLLCQSAPASVCGSIYHITNGEPIPFAEAARQLFGLLMLPVRYRRLPFAVAYAAAGMMELAALLTPSGREPMLTRATASMIGRSQTLDIGAARRELGYSPAVTVRDGMIAYAEWRERQDGLKS
ncbi:NAD-dependent epimerase/dehydratase family protein [Paenibacillus ginsengarvi]|uniref:NAD-dependent epimerase/dehydratase family protein n=1 Tax=Paenibacillus ginsengarvi TaxID=400777 RepID=A0A3B0BXU5_9BACL|nr:NAD-dependent epimerase/dehydratase family protein [Paenibacillus ginsengarvi]RKN77144.1 NAD-dependent epimerase/dehydratase family protein [Paenibacillus ginsengarvi]